jgi:DNA-binding CsgD family transcriptional regulator
MLIAVSGSPNPSLSLVARGAEQTRIMESLRAAAVGAGGAVVVRGEAGIGKSALLERAVAGSRAEGWTVLAARAETVERHLPYAVLTRAVASLPKESTEDLRSLAAVLRDALDVGSEQTMAAVHRASFRFFAAVRDLAPAVLVVDDLPAADEDTVALISALLLRPAPFPLILFASQRRPYAGSNRAMALLLERLAADGALALVDLHALDRAGIAELIRVAVGRPPDEELTGVVAARSGGNPLFAHEVLVGLRASGAVGLDDTRCWLDQDTVLMSSDRRAALLHRVLEVDDDARQVAGIVALLVSARVERLPLISAIANLPLDRVGRAFDALVAQGVLMLDSRSDYRFTHELMRDALYQDIGPAGRWQWHREAARWLAEQIATPEVELELATHVREIASEGDVSAIRALTRAAEITCAAAPRSSIPWYRRALSITPTKDPERGSLLMRFARALFLAGRPREAAEVGREALGLLEPGPVRTRTVALVVESLYETASIDDALSAVQLDRGSNEPTLHLLGLAANLLIATGRPDEARVAVAECERRLASGSPMEQIAALCHLAHVYYLSGELDRLPHLWVRLRQGLAAVPPTAQLGAVVTMTYVRALAGDTRGYVASIGEANGLLEASGWTLYRAELAVAEAQYAYLVGDWDRVLALATEVGGELEEAEAFLHLSPIRAIEAELLSNRGEWRRARQIATRRYPSHPLHQALRVYADAGVELLSGTPERAAELLAEPLGLPGLRSETRALLLSRRVEANQESGNRAALDADVAELAELSNGTLSTGIAVALGVAIGRATGNTAQLLEGRRLSDDWGIAFGRGRSRLALGELDIEPEVNLGEAYAIFHELGATPWRRKVATVLREHGLKVPRHRSRSELLTETETHIARLIQQGRSNRDIAGTLSLSVKTVDAYLTRIYVKTCCTSRLELARAVDAGLLE